MAKKNYERELQKTNQSLEFEKQSREKSISYVKWKGYDILYNNWIGKKACLKGCKNCFVK